MSRFPFGLPATRRPPRRPAGSAALFVLGVHPSALHIRWQRPDGMVAGALAVADEPEVFWDGADAGKRVSHWKDSVGWQPGWGTVNPAGGNGSSGRHIAKHVLEPLGVSADAVHFTDCLPTYFVKSGRISQAQVLAEVYGPFAAAQDLPVADLPPRPSASQLVSRAVEEEGANLHEQLCEADAPAIVTLGQEAADVLAVLTRADRVVLTPDDTYGRERVITVDGRKLGWTALIHPGNRGEVWQRSHARWVRNHHAAGAPAE